MNPGQSRQNQPSGCSSQTMKTKEAMRSLLLSVCSDCRKDKAGQLPNPLYPSPGQRKGRHLVNIQPRKLCWQKAHSL